MEKISITQRDLLLMPFPYSDLHGNKVRPVLVVSNNKFNNSSADLIVCCVTSNMSKELYTVLINKNNLEEGKLFEDCCVKVENIAKIEKSKVVKKIGKLKLEIFQEVVMKIHLLLKD